MTTTDTNSTASKRAQSIAEARAAAALQRAQERGTTHKQEATGTSLARSSETASTAVGAHVEAMAKARFFVALQRPRDLDVVRERLLQACEEARFAEAAFYELERRAKNEETGKWETILVPGLSIRFAEAVRQAMGNMDVETTVLVDDDDKLIAQVITTDLEANNTERHPVVVRKTVERHKLRDGQHAIGTRKNSYGETVHIVAATEAEITERLNSGVSRAMRNGILRLLRVDIKQECWDQLEATNKLAAQQAGVVEKVVQTFHGLGVKQAELERFLGHPLTEATKDGPRWRALESDELQQLRATARAIRSSDVTWAEVLESRGLSAAAGSENKGAASASPSPAAETSAPDPGSDRQGEDAPAAKESAAGAGQKKQTERDLLIAKVGAMAASIGVLWPEIAAKVAKINAGREPSSLDALTVPQAKHIEAWLRVSRNAPEPPAP